MKTPWWFLHKTPLAFLLLPFSFLYFLGSRFVFLLRKIKPYKSRRPVVCIGNIFAGGVGKTPVVRIVAGFLDAPVVMRGYKKSLKTGGVGDEALMLAKSGLQVHVGDRKSNLILLNKQKNKIGPIVMDDGFQNPSIQKDLSIIVFDEKLGMGNGFLLPAGPLRETKTALKRANAILIIKSQQKVKRKIKIPKNIPVFYAYNELELPCSESDKLIAFAGIGYPKKFFSMLKNVVVTKSFPDHYQYTDKDLENLFNLAEQKNARLITTEKDWVRLPKYAKNQILYAKLITTIEDSFFVWLKEALNDNN